MTTIAAVVAAIPLPVWFALGFFLVVAHYIQVDRDEAS